MSSEVTIKCDESGCKSIWKCTQSWQVYEARTDARLDGWTWEYSYNLPRSRDYCPEHRKDRRA